MDNEWRVVSAAMLMKDGLIVPGVRHFSPDMRAVLERIYGEGYHLKVKEQGFIDAKGNFLTRKEAKNMFGEHTKAAIRNGGELTLGQMMKGKWIFKARITFENGKEIRGNIAMSEEDALEKLEEAIKNYENS